MEIAGKVAVVTGGAWGIGRGTALRLAAEGAAVLVADLDDEKERLQEVSELVKQQGGSVRTVVADASSEADWRRVVAFAEEELGGLDVLVNNASPASARTGC